jgi:N-acetyl-gamma-glutamyl-phosphate reductase
MTRIRVGIVNITGYIGSELARLLVRHPEVEIRSVTGRSNVGQKVSQVFPHLYPLELTIERELDQVEMAFSALPHKASAEAVLPLLKKGIRIIDASADFRLKDAAQYSEWYGFEHPAPHLLAEAIYGLPELHRDEIASARLVANPGCYPTSAILALAPAVKEGILSGPLVIDSKSGVSGAGRTPGLNTHFPEANENLSAYAVSGHRHLPEIAQELSALSTASFPPPTFLPHLVPMSRGLMSCCYGPLNERCSLAGEKGDEELMTLYRDFYSTCPFVRVTDHPPQTKHTWGSNMCLVYPTIDRRSGMLRVISCLDNLVKGGAGQAVQNMNLMLGLSETTALDALPVYP